jgi:hypothetical protein
MGSGTTQTPPDIEPILNALIGTDASGVFSCVAGQTQLGSFSMCRWFGNEATLDTGIWMEQLAGCWVNEGTLTVNAGEAPTWSFSGGAKTHIHTGYSTLGANASASATVTVQSDDWTRFETGSIVQMTSDSAVMNQNGYKVSSSVETGAILTLVNVSDDAAASITNSSGNAIYPWVPTDSTLGTPISGNLGSLSLAIEGITAITVPITAAELTINNNVKPIDDQAFEAEVSDYVLGWREITGSFSMRMRRDLLSILGERKQFSVCTATLTIGDTVGYKMTLVIRCEMDFSDVETPDVADGTEASITVPFTCVATSAENELTLTYN